MNVCSINLNRFERFRQAIFFIFAAFFLGLGLVATLNANAAPLVVIFADRLSIEDVYDTSNGPLTMPELDDSVVGLVSPGLPNHKAGGPYSNLYATVTAGDVVDSSNQYTGLLQRELYVGAKPGDVTLKAFGNASTVVNKMRLRALIQSLRTSPKNKTLAPGILLVGVLPVSEQNPDEKSETWSDLTPIVWISCGGSKPGNSQQLTFTSDTTHTTGLIALRDIAPTILETEGLPIPESMSGSAAHVAFMDSNEGGDRERLLFCIANITRENQLALAPFGWIFGIAGGVILLASIYALKGGQSGSKVLQLGLRYILCIPISLLIVPTFLVEPLRIYNPTVYLLVIAAFAIPFSIRARIGIIFATISGVLLLDAFFFNSHLVARSLLSGYWLSGIRFYGIGNEFMGILIGSSIMLMVFARELLKKSGRGPSISDVAKISIVGLWYMTVLFLLASPQYGAKAGGAVAACGAFVPSIWSYIKRKSPGIGSWLIGIVIGFGSIFVFSAISVHFGARPTHIQSAINLLLHGDYHSIAHIALRKAKMAARVGLSPGAISGMVGFLLVIFVANRTSVSGHIREFLGLPDRQTLRWGVVSALWGMLACVLFNDSGVVAALLLFGIVALTVLHEMLGSGGSAIADIGA